MDEQAQGTNKSEEEEEETRIIISTKAEEEEEDKSDATKSEEQQLSAKREKHADNKAKDTTNDSDDDDSSSTSSSQEEDEDDDEYDGIGSSRLILRSFFVALCATVVTFLHLDDNHHWNSSSSSSLDYYELLSNVLQRTITGSSSSLSSLSEGSVTSRSAVTQQESVYKTKWNLDFCLEDAFEMNISDHAGGGSSLSLNNSTATITTTVVAHHPNHTSCLQIDKDRTSTTGVSIQEFKLKSYLLDWVLEYYDLDSEILQQALAYYSKSNNDGDDDDKLKNNKIQRTSYSKARTIMYKQPDVGTFYMDGKKHKKVEYSFTGFATKFLNLSPKPVLLFWDGGEYEDELSDKIQPYESVGTAAFPGHQFYITPEYDTSHVLKRFFLTEDVMVQVYDPLTDSNVPEHTKLQIKESMSEEDLGKYTAHLVNLAFAKEYLVLTGRQWLSMFPRALPRHHMWEARYFGQKHRVRTRETHFTSLPKNPKELEPIYFVGEYGKSSDVDKRPLANYRSSQKHLELTMTVVSCAPRVFEIGNFLSDVEVDHILGLIQEGDLQRSTVVGDIDVEPDETRTSSNTWLDRDDSPIIDAIYRRAADLLKIDESIMRYRTEDEASRYSYVDDDEEEDYTVVESLQLVHYDVGQEYTAHHDFTYPPSDSLYQPTRFATLLLYLNEGMVGGETRFPKAVNSENHQGLTVKPSKGKAVLFYNMLPDGNMDELSQHAALPVMDGEKYLLNFWIWDPVLD